MYVFHVPGPFTLPDQLALSPDGRTLVVGSDTGLVTFYDARSHRRLGSLVPPGFSSTTGREEIAALAFSHDGSLLAVGGDRTIAFFDLRSRKPAGNPVRIPKSGYIGRLVFSPDDRTLAVGYTDDTRAFVLDQVDTTTGKPLSPAHVVGPEFQSIDKLTYTPNGRSLITSDWVAGRVVVLDAIDMHVLRDYRIPSVTSIAVSPNGRTLAVGKDDGSVGLMSLATGRYELLGRHAPLGGIWSAEFTPDGRSLVTTSADHTAIVWDVRTGTSLDALTGQGDIVHDLAISPDGRTAYTASNDGLVVAWDIGGRRRLGRTLPESRAYPADIYSHPQPTAVAVSPDGKLLALSPRRDAVQVWDLRTLRPVGAPLRGFHENDTGTAGGAEDLAFSPDSRLLAAGGGSGSTVVVWNLETRRVVHRFTPPSDPQPHGDGLAFSPDGRMLANGDGGHGALLWDLETNLMQKLPERGQDYVLSLAFSPDGTRVATVNNHYPLTQGELWDITRRPARRLSAWLADNAGGLGTNVAFSPDGKLVATGSAGVVTLRDAKTGRPVRSLPIPNGYNGVVAFAPDGRTIAVLAHDGAEIWDIKTGTQIGAALPGASPQYDNPGGPGNLRYTRDGQLVMVSPNGLATIWDVDPAAWSGAACRIAGRQLTHAEWDRFVSTGPYERVCP
jgi:WD40 repeat protein